jgi:hypothetical protein
MELTFSEVKTVAVGSRETKTHVERAFYETAHAILWSLVPFSACLQSGR